MALRVAGLVALIGYAGGAVVRPELLLPEPWWARLILALLGFLLLAHPVHVAYRLRTAFEKLPQVDRERLHELRALAGRATEGYVGFGLFYPFPETTADLEEFRSAYASLRHYPKVFREARQLYGYLRYIASQQGSVSDHMEVLDPAEAAYHRLIAACNELLTPPADQPPPKAPAPAPPSSRESSG